MFIEDQQALESFAARSATTEILAIDTEFMREKTYYPKLCLLQIQTDSETALIDPFGVDDLKVLNPLLENPAIVKLFHAGTQDLEIIHNVMGCVPAPLFDTQVAAALLGHTQQIGYAGLVHSLCGVSLKKADSFTDWSRRPLSKSQLKYAADDVIYLPRMYKAMKDQLEEKGRLSWLDGDFRAMEDADRFRDDSRERYRKLKRIGSLNRRQLSAAREVAAWREHTAAQRDLPRKWIITDEQVVESCKREARTIDELFMVRGLQNKLKTGDARAIVDAICTGLDLPESEMPHGDRKSRNEANVDIPLDLMSGLVRMRARENDIAFQTLANHADLIALARGHREGLELLTGWRKSMIGDELIALLEGRITLSVDGDTIKVTAV